MAKAMSQWIREEKSLDYVCKAQSFERDQKKHDFCIGRKCMHWTVGSISNVEFDPDAYEASGLTQEPEEFVPVYSELEGLQYSVIEYPVGRCGLSSRCI